MTSNQHIDNIDDINDKSYKNTTYDLEIECGKSYSMSFNINNNHDKVLTYDINSSNLNNFKPQYNSLQIKANSKISINLLFEAINETTNEV